MNQEFFRLAVADPCSQDWDAMHSREGGRHCDSCKKTITDFTSKSNEEIQSFFLQRNMEPVCGRFNTGQLAAIRIHIPAYILQKPIAAWKKYLIVLLICFAKDLLPPNAAVGLSQAAYGQTKHAYVKGKHHRPKKAKLHYRPFVIKDIGLQTVTMGFTTSAPEEQISVFDTYLKYPGGNEEPLLSRPQSPEKKEPIKEGNSNRSAFILPWAVRRRKKARRV